MGFFKAKEISKKELRKKRFKLSQDLLESVDFEQVKALFLTTDIESIMAHDWLVVETEEGTQIFHLYQGFAWHLNLSNELRYHSEFYAKRGFKKEPFYKAIKGDKPLQDQLIVDLTAGTLSDSLLMAYWGAQVIAIERNPILQVLNYNALVNLNTPKIRLDFMAGESQEELTKIENVDSYFFDPMYQNKKSKTAPRVEMQIMREIVGDDSDQVSLMKYVLEKLGPHQKLVVKRPIGVEKILSDEKFLQGFIQHTYAGKSTQYDTYRVLS